MQGARVVRVVAAMLAAIAFIAGLGNLVRLTDNEHTEAAIYVDLHHHRYDARVPALRFTLTATSLNPAERRLQGSLMFVRSTQEETPLLVDTDGRPISDAGTIRPEFADTKLSVTLRNLYFGETTILYPLANVVNLSVSEDARRVPVSIPADVDPTQFPNDTYSVDLSVSASLPREVRAITPQKTSIQDPVNVASTGSVPIAFGMALADRLGLWNLSTDRTVAGGIETSPYTGSSDYKARIVAEFGRGWAYWAFIYAVSLMPAVIGLSFFVRTRRRRGSNDTSAAMELAAALLALIALRQVFVPTDIVGLTRLDFLLGVQLLAVCWLMAVTYVAEPPTPKPPARPAEPPAAQPKPVKPRPRKPLLPRVPDGAVRRIT